MNPMASCPPDARLSAPTPVRRPVSRNLGTFPVPLPSEPVLVVEDEPRTRRYLCLALQKSGFKVLEAGHGAEAMELFHRQVPRVVLLDIGLPDMSGFDLCRAMRQQREDLAILMATGRAEDADKVTGLELGADEYLVKPFGPEVLVASIKAVLRRCTHAPSPSGELAYGPLRLDPLTLKAFKDDRELDLTPKEFALLALFLRHPGQVLTRERLHQEIWGEHHYCCPKTLDVFICKLREKLEADPAHPVHLRTERGVGFVYQ